MPDRLRELWDFSDLDVSEERLRKQLEAEDTDAGRAEVLTQLARVEGLRDRFDEGEVLIVEAESLAGDSAVARARIDLERGRLRRSGGDPDAARPLFESAFATAVDDERWFIAADAAHMAALVARDREGFVRWTSRGIEIADEHEAAAYWRGSLLNNLGWEQYEAGEYDAALDTFRRALDAREREPEKAEPIAHARYAVGQTLRALDRSDEAIPLLEQAVAWADGAGKPGGWLREELAEEYAAVGRGDDAREQARLAIPVLEKNDPSFAEDADRSGRLRALAGES
ncbi:MAG TPA: tetratricopeptide repeat protein [Gaiellaceae bacterium]|nr:tetratricopeptide repeat protein [Gaiellaceae bacterium]